MPSRRDNLRRTLAGESPAWVPFSPNFKQWFDHHQTFGSLPPELRGCKSYLQAMKALDCDIFSRNIDGGCRVRDVQLPPHVEQTEGATGPRVVTTYQTPHGDLRMVHQKQTKLSTEYEEEYLVKDWEKDGDAFRSLLEQREYSWDEAAFCETHRLVGDDGIVNVACAYTPLKMLHHNFGLEYTCCFVIDHPEAAKEICEVYWQAKVRPLLDRLARHPLVESVILMDNVDTPFYSPGLAAEYWTPYVKEAAEVLHSQGKYLFVHACGKLAGLAPVFAACGVDGLEGISHPPLGDWPAPQAQACNESFIFVGGFSAQEQQLLDDDGVRDFYRRYLPGISKRRCIFSSSCQTAIGTSWERIKLVRDICREWGGRPAAPVCRTT